MAKKRFRKRRTALSSQVTGHLHRNREQLQLTLGKAERLIRQGQPDEAIALLSPLLASHARAVELHHLLAQAYLDANRLWEALPHLEQAQALTAETAYWHTLSTIYLELELSAHALHALRQTVQHASDPKMEQQARALVAPMEEIVADLATALGISVQQSERGLLEMEKSIIALHLSDFQFCIAACRRAIKLLGDWPPPHNNLSQALFFAGQPQEAIATARRVAARHPGNLQALSNITRFLAWTGREAEARELWAQMQKLTPADPIDRLKMAEAAAALDEDEQVYQLLIPLDSSPPGDTAPPESLQDAQFLLAIAEANLGRKQALSRFKALQQRHVHVDDYIAALQDKRPGLGWSNRYPYFRSIELLHRKQIDALIELVKQKETMPEHRFRQRVAHFIERFPQAVRAAEKMIWEDQIPEGGVAILVTLDTPAARTALRRFGLSQAGDDDVRMSALMHLAKAGEISLNDSIRFWSNGEWHDTLLRQYEVSGEPEVVYDRKIINLLNQGNAAIEREDYAAAERAFRRLIEQHPEVKEAYNNLGTAYAQQGEHEKAKAMFHKALEIDPLYTFPRCNLASYLLEEGDVEGAEEMIKPLADRQRFHPQDMAFYAYTQARILTEEEEYEEARAALEIALYAWPEYERAQDLLQWLDDVAIPFQKNLALWQEEQAERWAAKRARLQAQLTTPDPSLAEALPLYTKEVLTGMARQVVPRGGWSTLRKAELVKEIAKALTDSNHLAWILTTMADDEQAALRQVLERGGAMPREEFAAAYDDDLEESPYWQWHIPESVMGHLRACGLLVESTVGGRVMVCIPSDVRPILGTHITDASPTP